MLFRKRKVRWLSRRAHSHQNESEQVLHNLESSTGTTEVRQALNLDDQPHVLIYSRYSSASTKVPVLDPHCLCQHNTASRPKKLTITITGDRPADDSHLHTFEESCHALTTRHLIGVESQSTHDCAHAAFKAISTEALVIALRGDALLRGKCLYLFGSSIRQ